MATSAPAPMAMPRWSAIRVAAAWLSQGSMNTWMPLAGRFGDHHALLARLHLDHIDHLADMIARYDAQIEAITVQITPAA
jgi:transposase